MAVPEGYRIPHLNTPRVPQGVDDAKARKHLLEKHGIEIAGGFGPLAGKIFRIGLMGPMANQGTATRILGKCGGALRVTSGAARAWPLLMGRKPGFDLTKRRCARLAWSRCGIR